MKRIVFLTCVGSLVLAMTAWSAPKHSGRPAGKGAHHAAAAKGGGKQGGKQKGGGKHFAAPRSAGGAKTHASHSSRGAGRGYTGINRGTQRGKHSGHVNRGNSRQNDRVAAGRAAKEHGRSNVRNDYRNIERANARAARSNERNLRDANVAISREREINRVARGAIAGQTSGTIVNNWRGDRFSGENYTAFRDYRRQWHDRNWWNNNYTRIILVSGGWWYWNAGYWYPAWGYDPYYTYYPYDGPIYGYGDLTPDQIILNVQVQLRNDGYDPGPIDGVLGRRTRRAIAAFQANNGLAVTSAVDEPTLRRLGLA